MSEWQRFRQIITDLKTVSVQTLVDARPPQAIASTWDLLEGDMQTQIDAALVPAGNSVRAQHERDLHASQTVRGQWLTLFKAFANLDETADAAEARQAEADGVDVSDV